MSKVLVVYYSKSGVTKKVATELADKLNADLEEIHENKNRNGLFGFIFSGRDAIKEKMADIDDIKANLKEYDKIIVGTPVWASKMATPALIFLRKYRNDIKNYSLVITQAGEGENKIMSQMDKYMDNRPQKSVVISNKDIKQGIYGEKLGNF